jgi:DNA processing protein
MARGIDSVAHRAALRVDGATCAVLGTGIDLTFPVANTTLQRIIAERGLLLTELAPGDSGRRFTFIMRNRLIAALAAVTIVVEAGRKSGALKTAEFAEAIGRSVGSVPGPVDSQTAVGTNQLLRDGCAIMIADSDDALTLAGVTAAPVNAKPRDLSPAEQNVLDVLRNRILTVEQIVDEAALPVGECLAAIGTLELEGIIESGFTGELRRRDFTRKPAVPIQ